MASALIQGPTLAQVLAAAWARPDTLPSLSPAQWRVLHTLRVCRTPALGGHQYRCAACGRDHFVPHSCGNRHCPQCQGVAAAAWLEAQEALLLPVPYFHLVFTLPHGLKPADPAEPAHALHPALRRRQPDAADLWAEPV